MSKLTNKIEAHDRTVAYVLEDKKYTVDYFQREYNWQRRHIEQLITDLTGAFLTEYAEGDLRKEGENYNNYYLGPFVVSEQPGQRSIIDGQQRLTSLTLLLIYLNNLQKSLGIAEKIETLIFSEHRGTKSFNLQIDERKNCLEGLFETGAYTIRIGDDPSTMNMVARYADIDDLFPEEINAKNLPFFIDWLKFNVVLVEIIAYSDDNAYTIFETMNDRGLNLTPTEMLKGYILSRFNPAKRVKANDDWKTSIETLKKVDPNEDQSFFQAWLRASFADTIRQGKEGSQNEDFEKIGTRFHSWVRENLKKLNLDQGKPEDFEQFIAVDFRFYREAYLRIMQAQTNFTATLPHVYYSYHWRIAPGLSFPLMLASLVPTDSQETVDAKIDLVARYIETFTVRRSINFRNFSPSSIRYTMYSLVKEIRNKDLAALHGVLSTKVAAMDCGWDKFQNFMMHGTNRPFVKFLLSRLTAHVDQGAGISNTFQTYYQNPGGKPFEVEHIWADDFNAHTDEFAEKNDFSEWRNSIGALVLLPNGTNQSYNDKPYAEKIVHYQKENLLVRSLCPLTYQNNPNFTNWAKSRGLKFQPHPDFKKADILLRQSLYQKLCEDIWAFPPAESPAL